MTNQAASEPKNRFPLAAANLPLLPTSTLGSHAPLGWLLTATAAMARGEYGPRDIDETLTDATDIAVLDQQRAGLDVIVDGEMRRLDFNLGFYEHLLGLEPLPVARRLGPEGHDQRGKWLVAGPLKAPGGLGTVDDYRYLLSVADRPTKATVPGPFTLAGRLELNGVYADRFEAAADLAAIVNAELKALVAAGADFVQIDEPSMAVYPDRANDLVSLFNRTVEGIDAKIGTHMCFGNFRGRPVARRTYAPLLPHLQAFKADQFMFEFANRELVELELWREFGGDKELGAGLIDVKNYSCETPELVAERVRTALRSVPPEKLWVVPDCGWSQTARWAMVRKLRAMVEGVAIVRRELAG